MKPILLVGIVLVVIGAVSLVYQGITYTTREKVLQIGPLESTKKTEKTITIATSPGRSLACSWDRVNYCWS